MTLARSDGRRLRHPRNAPRRRFVTLAALCVLVAAMSLPAYSNGVLWGDVNRDGQITAVDAMLLRQHLNGLTALTTESLQFADADRNNKVEHADADFIDSIIVGANQQYSYINGVVYGVNGERVPLEGALVELADGVSKSALTGADGKFHLQVPGAGLYMIHISKDGYSFADRNCQVASGRDFVVDDIYLTVRDSAVTLIGDEGGSHTNTSGTFEVIVPPGAITSQVRAKYAAKHKMAAVPETLPFRTTGYEEGTDLPGPLPPTSVFTYASLHEPDVEFVTSVTVRVKNLKGFPPNTPVPYAFWNSQTQQWEDSVLGAVTPDGQWIQFDVKHFTPIDWNLVPNNPVKPPHSANPHPPTGHPCRRSGGANGSPFVSFATGNVSTDYALPGFRAYTRIKQLDFTYSSATASPTTIVGADVDWSESAQIGGQLQMVSCRLQIEGQDIWRRVVIDQNKPSKVANHTFLWDGRNARGELVGTGLYKYAITLANHFAGHYWSTMAFGARPITDTGVAILVQDNPFIPVKSDGLAAVVNDRQSPFGAGWSIAYLPRLFVQPYTDRLLIMVNWGNVRNEFFEAAIGEEPLVYRSLSREKNTIVQTSNGFQLSQPITGDRWLFSPQGQATQFISANGVTVEYRYDSDNRLFKIIYPPNQVVTFFYDKRGLLEAVMDPAGRATFFHVNTNGDLTEVTDPEGNKTRYAYDSEHRLVSETDPEGHSAAIEYDQYSRARRMTEPDGAVQQFFPEEVQNLINDLPSDQGGWYNPDDALDVPVTQYVDARGDVITLQTTVLQDQGRFKVTRTLGSGDQESMLYDYDWTLYEYTGVDGATYRVEYDGNSKLSKIENLQTGQTYGFTWDPVTGKRATMTEPNGKTWRQEYDAKGNLTKITSPEGRTLSYAYDAAGRVTEVSTSDTESLRFTYDSAGNMTQIVDPDGIGTNYAYDGKGLAAAVADDKAASWRRTYDNANRVKSVVDPAGNAIQYEYDKQGNPTRVTDRNGAVWRFEYDARNRVKRMIRPGGAEEFFAYDGNDNMTNRTLANGKSVVYRYDGNDCLSEYVTSDKEKGYLTRSLSDGKFEILNEKTVETVQLDKAGVVTQAETELLAVNMPAIKRSYGHDAFGHRTSMTDVFGQQQYRYSDDGFLIEIADTDGSKIVIGRDEENRIASIAFPNGVTTEYARTPAGRVRRIVTRTSASTLAEVAARYDAAGNPFQLSYTRYDGPTPQTRTVACVYDGQWQLREFTDSALTGAPLANRSYTYNERGELASDGVYEYEYDAAGNLTSKTRVADQEKWEFSYNGLNRLSGAGYVPAGGGTTPTLECQYGYDAIARRIAKTIAGVTTYYVYDGPNLLYELDSRGNITARYTHIMGEDVDFPVIAYKNGKRYYYHLDPIDSVYLVTDESGQVAARYAYTPFGELLSKEGAFISPFGYTSREQDNETGLACYRFRYYMPQLGRFTQIDPAQLMSGDNLYTYAYNNPQRFVDPFGLKPTGCGGGPGNQHPGHPPHPNHPTPPGHPTQPAHPDPGQHLQEHLDQGNHWAQVSQQVNNGQYNNGNAATDSIMYGVVDQGAHPAVGPAITVLQATPSTITGIGMGVHHNGANNAAMDFVDQEMHTDSSSTQIPHPFGFGDRPNR